MSIEGVIRNKIPLIESQIKAIAESSTAGVRRLRYLVYGGSDEFKPDDQQLLAALAFGPSVCSLKSRDNFIGWSSEVREKNLHLVVNNVRFLILPWIRSKNLASRILGGIARKMPADWENRYHYRPVLLETLYQAYTPCERKIIRRTFPLC